jgi:CRP/FNR family cyclic AMP-dependent transcriptional regulator
MMIPDLILKTLQRIPWFVELNPVQMESLAQITTLRPMKKGETLFCEGDSEDGLYIVIEGQMQIEAHVPGHGMMKLHTAEPLDIIGWSALTPVIRQRTASARAETDCRLLCLNSQILNQLCEDDHDLGYIIMRRIANMAATRLLVTRLRLFEIIPPTNEQIQVPTA